MSRPTPPSLADRDLLAGHTVHVWSIGLDMPPAVATALEGVLDQAETARLAAYRDPARRRAFVAAHGMLRLILGAYRAERPAQIRLGTGRWGKPELVDGDGLRFSLSHSGDAVLLAVTGDRYVGIDVEGGRTERTAGALAARYFPPSEAARVRSAAPGKLAETYLRLWTRKEACVKAAGARLTQGLGLRVAGDGPRVVTDPTGRLPAPWLVCDLAAPSGYQAAIALSGIAPYRVVRRRWQPPDQARPLESGGALSAAEDAIRVPLSADRPRGGSRHTEGTIT